MSRDIRADLVAAHERSLRHVAAPGARLTGARRVEVAELAVRAALDPDPPPPWARPTGDPLLDATHRLARHAGTLTQEWYDELITSGVHPVEWVEVVGVVIAVLAPITFARAVGEPLPAVPGAEPGAPHGREAAELAPARLNWVPVAAPADRVASVVQALTAVPDEVDNMWQLAGAQYMSNEQMSDPGWSRGTLTRPQMELIAARISERRDCVF